MKKETSKLESSSLIDDIARRSSSKSKITELESPSKLPPKLKIQNVD